MEKWKKINRKKTYIGKKLYKNRQRQIQKVKKTTYNGEKSVIS